MKKDVHTEHCCIQHGCKYGDRMCTVTRLKAPQSHPCEDCSPGVTVSSLPSLPIPRFKKVREIYQLEDAIAFICPDHTSGRRAMYTTFVLHLESGRSWVIGRELSLAESRDQVTEHKRRFLLKEFSWW